MWIRLASSSCGCGPRFGARLVTRRRAHRIPANSRFRAPRFFSATGGPSLVHCIADARTGAGREIFRAEKGTGSLFHPVEATQQLFWSASDRLVFPWESTGWNHLYSLPTSGGNPSELTPGDGEVEHVVASSDRKTIYYSTNIGDIDRRHVAESPQMKV